MTPVSPIVSLHESHEKVKMLSYAFISKLHFLTEMTLILLCKN